MPATPLLHIARALVRNILLSQVTTETGRERLLFLRKKNTSRWERARKDFDSERDEREERICEDEKCGKGFLPRSSLQKYCSPECQNRCAVRRHYRRGKVRVFSEEREERAREDNLAWLKYQAEGLSPPPKLRGRPTREQALAREEWERRKDREEKESRRYYGPPPRVKL